MVHSLLARAALFAVAICPTLSANPVTRDIDLGDGTTIRNIISLPADHDVTKPVCTVIAFGPGQQDAQMARYIRGYLEPACRAKGWALATPVPPRGKLFHANPDLYKALIADLDKALVPEFGVYHVVGSSNGGASALSFALEHPSRTGSVCAFPGAVWNLGPKDLPAALESLRGIPVRLWSGGDDTVKWLDAGRALQSAAQQTKPPSDLVYTELPGEPHVISTKALPAATIAEVIEQARPGRQTAGGVSPTREQLDCAATLDALHTAAAKADAEAYWQQFTPDAVFLGTDATERWTLEQFRRYASPIFAKNVGKSAWVYTLRPGTRNVTIDPSGTVAFFDELLDNDSYGTTRGTGMLRKIVPATGTPGPARWQIAQYSLSLPIPNPLAKRVAALIRSEEPRLRKDPAPPKP